jgi:hypothetical protein
MTAPTPREHALRVALLSALLDEVKAAHTQARADAAGAFASARADGQTQQLVMLPTGERVGLISIKAGADSAEFDEAGLLAWVREHMPHQVQDAIEPYAWDSADIIALVKEHFPGVVKPKVRAAYREQLIEEMLACDGKLTDPATGEVDRLGTVRRGKPTGAFSYRADKGGAGRIADEWRAGRLAGVEIGPLTQTVPAVLPAGGETDAG